MEVLRAKTLDLFKYVDLTDIQKKNSEINLKEIKNVNLQLKSYPQRLVLELTSACNFKCIMCGRDGSSFENTFFNLDYLRQIETILYYIKEVTLFGWGEPTLHPKFNYILELLNKYPVRKYFVTNGSTLPKIRESLFEYKVDIMAISLDGATAKTNNRIRTNSNFNKIISELQTIVQQKKNKNVNHPYINFVFTLMKSNLNELPDMVNLAHNLGIEEVKAVYLTAFSEKLRGEILWGCAKEVRKVFSETVERGNKLGIKIKLPYTEGDDIAGNKFHKDCFVGWRDFFISSDGCVRPCQSISQKLFYMSKYDSFHEAWNSDEMINFRSVVNNSDKMWDECKRCYQSSHANWNRESAFLQVGQKFAPNWERR